jgi:hypothetical protein
MSTIKVSAIQDLSGGTDVDVPNAAKAWVNFNGTGTVAIRADYNVTSITDNGTADYTINFTNALTDNNYCPVSEAGLLANYGAMIIPSALTTSTYQFRTLSNVDTYIDMVNIYVAVFR